MEQLIQYFIWLPATGYLVTLLVPRKSETAVSGVAIFFAALQLCALTGFLIYWGVNNHLTLDLKHTVLYQSDYLEISLNFFFDRTTAFFAAVGTFIYFLVVIFSRYYMHRDPGFKRYFTTISFFFVSYNLIIFSGNFETLFIGWEFLGLCSFLLIAYYRERYLPVKNSMKTIAVYRIGDICLFLAMWLSHHLWHENITFIKMNNPDLINIHIIQNYWSAVAVSLLILIAAAVKSAQLPFSSWLPRAMEGPTTSSAVFYGSLSVHLGVFILLRTYPYWEHLGIVKIAIIALGLITALIATSIARVQSSVKTQIAYSSIAQIGLIFIEISLGLHLLALIHFTGNALLRTYQLLVSPSVLSYKIHDMVFSYSPKKPTSGNSSWNKIKNTIYLLSIKEWNLDTLSYGYLWRPFKWTGKSLNLFSQKSIALFLGIFLLAGIFIFAFSYSFSPVTMVFISAIFSAVSIGLIIKSITEKGDAMHTWIQLTSSQFFILLSVAMVNKNFSFSEMLLYLAGIIVAAITGLICLKKIKSIDQNINMNQNHGYIYLRPVTGLVFLICCLALAGLPLTPSFLGIDILFSHIQLSHPFLIIFTALSYLLFEIAVLRIYAKIFLGQYKKETHAMAYKSS